MESLWVSVSQKEIRLCKQHKKTESFRERRRKLFDGRRVKNKTKDVVKVSVEGTTQKEYTQK